MGSLELDALPDACSLVADQIAAPVAGMHDVIASRAFRYTPAAGSRIQHAHDAVVGSVYRAIPRGAAAVGAVVGAVWGARTSQQRPVSETEPGAHWQASLNAMTGDRLAEHGNPLAITTSFREDTGAATPGRVAAGFDGSRTHAVVLLHGMGQTESCWQGSGGLTEALDSEASLVPVPVRYNSGRPIDDVGGEVAALIEAMWQARPEIVVSLVGFSMGGLVARAAYSAAVDSGFPWAGAVRHIITIGTPHGGSYWAQAARIAAAGLSTTRTTRPLSRFLDGRSAAIQDVEWADGLERLPRLPGVRHHFVAATVTGDRKHPVGILLGDLVVRVGSATAPAVTSDDVIVLGGRNHAAMLADAAVRSRLVDWLRAVND